MPSQTGSSDSNDLASKYSHLLQPIRDLTKNWDIDVAAQLEEYLAEVRIKVKETNRMYKKTLKPTHFQECPKFTKQKKFNFVDTEKQTVP